MSPRSIKLVCALGGAVALTLFARRLTATRPHFFARCVVLYGMPGSRQAMDVSGIVVSPDNRTVAALADYPDPMLSGDEQFWDVETRERLPGKKENVFRSDNHWVNPSEIYGVHRTRAGLTGVLGEKDFALRKLKSREIVRRFQTPTKDNCTAWTFSPDGKTLWWADKQQRIFWQSIE